MTKGGDSREATLRGSIGTVKWCWGRLGPGPCWGHSFVGPMGAICLLGCVGTIQVSIPNKIIMFSIVMLKYVMSNRKHTFSILDVVYQTQFFTEGRTILSHVLVLIATMLTR